MNEVPLSSVAHINMGTAPPGNSYNTHGDGIPMIAGAGDYGEINPEPKKWTTSPTRIVEPGDLIICVRATIGDINWADKQYCLGRGVAGLRPKNGQLDIKYLAHFIASKKQALTALGTGSTFLAIRRGDLENLAIPLPSLEKQKRIAAILDKADAISRKRAEAIRMADDFLKAAFLDMFGDPVRNPKKWKIDSLGHVGELDRGRSRHRPRNAPELLGGPYPLIQTGDIANSGGYIRGYSQTYSELGLAQSRIWPVGTLCITIAANIARTAILTIEACFPDSVVGFRPYGKVRTEYIQYWLSFLQKILEENAPESAQKNINLEILRALKVPLPRISLQDRFVRLIQKTEQDKEKMRGFENDGNDLFNSLVQRSFRGEL